MGEILGSACGVWLVGRVPDAWPGLPTVRIPVGAVLDLVIEGLAIVAPDREVSIVDDDRNQFPSNPVLNLQLRLPACACVQCYAEAWIFEIAVLGIPPENLSQRGSDLLSNAEELKGELL